MLIYDGIGDPDAFESVAALLATTEIPPVRGAKTEAYQSIAAALHLPEGMVRHAARKAASMEEFPLVLCDRGGVVVPVAVVKSPKGFEAACRCAVRHFPGTLKNLELPDWVLTDGRQQIALHALLRPEGRQ